MAAGLTRRFYFWRQGRLEEIVKTRKSKFGSWSMDTEDPDLIVAIEETSDGPTLELGYAATPALLAWALIRNSRPGLRISSTDLGPQLPTVLIDQVVQITVEATNRLVQRFSRLNAEERMTGALSDRLDQSFVSSQDGWSAGVFVEGFSSQTKEPLTGADIGILVDIRRGNSVTLKAVWIQAKRDPDSVKNPLTLDELLGQMNDMAKHTKESFGMVYSPSSVYLVNRDAPNQRLELSDVIADTLRCRHGDRRPTLIASTLERHHVIELTLFDADAQKLMKNARRRKR